MDARASGPRGRDRRGAVVAVDGLLVGEGRENQTEAEGADWSLEMPG